jgi:hypothetical protein
MIREGGIGEEEVKLGFLWTESDRGGFDWEGIS